MGRTPGGAYAPKATYYVAGNNGAPGTAALQPQPAAGGNFGGGVASGVPCAQGGACANGGGYAGGGVSGEGGDDKCRLFDNHGDMPQHYPYYPAMHGYYYFHPYHHTHIDYQRDFATQWGMDPRNPYANDIFKVVYAEVRAAQDESPERIPVPPTNPAKRRAPMPVTR